MRKFKQGWLRAYRDYIAKHESPDLYHFWVAVTLVSSALRRRVWVDREAYILYPNLYTFLLAKSGSCRKSVAMDLGLDILHEVKDVTVVHERMSLEGLMDKMNRVTLREDGKLIPDGSVFIHADELADLFGKASYITDLMSFLTAAYSCRQRLEFLTRNKAFCGIRNAYPTMLSGCTTEQFGDIFPSMALASGFLGRVNLIVGIRGNRIGKPIIRHEMKDDLINDLREISMMSGEMVMADGVNESFINWYEALPVACASGFQAYYERKHDHVLKLAMILSAAESDNMIITEAHVAQAIAAIDLVEQTLDTATEAIGATSESILADFIMGIIRAHHPEDISHSDLLRRVYKRVRNKNEFQEIIDTLIDTRRIQAIVHGKGRYYKLREG